MLNVSVETMIGASNVHVQKEEARLLPGLPILNGRHYLLHSGFKPEYKLRIDNTSPDSGCLKIFGADVTPAAALSPSHLIVNKNPITVVAAGR